MLHYSVASPELRTNILRWLPTFTDGEILQREGTTLTTLLIADIKSSSVQVLGRDVKVVVNAGSNAEPWNTLSRKYIIVSVLKQETKLLQLTSSWPVYKSDYEIKPRCTSECWVSQVATSTPYHFIESYFQLQKRIFVVALRASTRRQCQCRVWSLHVLRDRYMHMCTSIFYMYGLTNRHRHIEMGITWSRYWLLLLQNVLFIPWNSILPIYLFCLLLHVHISSAIYTIRC